MILVCGIPFHHSTVEQLHFNHCYKLSTVSQLSITGKYSMDISQYINTLNSYEPILFGRWASINTDVNGIVVKPIWTII